MSRLFAAAVIVFAGWAFSRLVAIREARQERERLNSLHDEELIIDRYRSAGAL